MNPLASCVTGQSSLDVNKVENFIKGESQTEAKLDDLSNLKDKPVWIFSGKEDKDVAHKVVDKTSEFFKDFGSNVKYVNDMDCDHKIPTNFDWVPYKCNQPGGPGIANAGFDGFGDFMKHIWPSMEGNLNPRTEDWKSVGDLSTFKQEEFVSGDFEKSGLAELGYLFTPKSCQGESAAHCKVHVFFHGCSCCAERCGTVQMEQPGTLHWWGVNDGIVLLPQVHATATTNDCCWDFWGYSGDQYYSKEGPQVKAVAAMVDRLLQKPGGQKFMQ